MYTFSVGSDDGQRMFVDGVVRLWFDGMRAIAYDTATFFLDAGPHTIRLEYMQGGGGQILDVQWSGPGFSAKVSNWHPSQMAPTYIR